jgi:hypothetical protein
VPEANCPLGFSFEELLALPELAALMALSAVLLPGEMKRLFLLAKLLLYRCIGAGFGDEEPEDAIAVSLAM